MTRPRVLAAVALAAAGAAGCHGGCGARADRGDGGAGGARYVAQPEGPEEPAVEGGTLRVHVEAEPPTLNPLVEHDAWSVWIGLGAVYDPLLRQDPATSALTPALATAWRVEDERALVFTMRAGVTWHDGRPLIVGDVVTTFTRLRRGGATPEVRAALGELTGIEARAPDEVVLRFARIGPLALQAIARVPILPAHRFTDGDLRPQAASRAPVGTGPFRFVEWRAGDRIVLERAPAPWGPRPHLDRIELRIVGEREVALELFRRGELDLIWQLAPAQVDRVLADPSLSTGRVVPLWLPRYAFIVWNQRRAPLGDRRVRQALTALIDRDRYLRVVFHGRARAWSGPYLPSTPAHDPSVLPWPVEVARGRALLDEAGLIDRDGDGVRERADGSPLRLSLLYSAGSPMFEPLGTEAREDLRRGGIELVPSPAEWAAVLAALRANAFDAAALLWMVAPQQDNWPLFHSSQAAGGQNYGAWANPEADSLLDALRSLPPGADRTALEHRLHRLVHDEQPYTFLGSPEADSLVAGRVRGYHPDADGPGFARLWLLDPVAAP